MESHQEQRVIREGAADEKLKTGNVYCKMGEGWTCIVTKTKGPDAGKIFLKCGENCSCTIEGERVSKGLELPPNVVSSGEAFCECGEGWSCAIFRSEGPDAASGKGFAECADAAQCSCTPHTKSTPQN